MEEVFADLHVHIGRSDAKNAVRMVSQLKSRQLEA